MRKAVQAAAAARRGRRRQDEMGVGNTSPGGTLSSSSSLAPLSVNGPQQQQQPQSLNNPGVLGATIATSDNTRRKATPEEAALTAKNYRLAKELSELRVRHREETKNVNRLTMENMNLASRCREAISHVAMLKKEVASLQRRDGKGGRSSSRAPSRGRSSRVSPTPPPPNPSRSKSPKTKPRPPPPPEPLPPVMKPHTGRALDVAGGMEQMDFLLSSSKRSSSKKKTKGTISSSAPPEPKKSPLVDALHDLESENDDDKMVGGSDDENNKNHADKITDLLPRRRNPLSPPRAAASSPARGGTRSNPSSNESSIISSFFPHSASPKIRQRGSGSGSSYNEEFPGDITSVNRLNSRQRAVPLGGFAETAEQDEPNTAAPSSTTPVNGSSSGDHNKTNSVSSIDAFEASFNLNFPDSFSPTATSSDSGPTASKSAEAAVNTNSATAKMPSAAAGKPSDPYNPFSSSPMHVSSASIAIPSLSLNARKEGGPSSTNKNGGGSAGLVQAPSPSSALQGGTGVKHLRQLRDPPGKNRTSPRHFAPSPLNQQQQGSKPSGGTSQNALSGGFASNQAAGTFAPISALGGGSRTPRSSTGTSASSTSSATGLLSPPSATSQSKPLPSPSFTGSKPQSSPSFALPPQPPKATEKSADDAGDLPSLPPIVITHDGAEDVMTSAVSGTESARSRYEKAIQQKLSGVTPKGNFADNVSSASSSSGGGEELREEERPTNGGSPLHHRHVNSTSSLEIGSKSVSLRRPVDLKLRDSTHEEKKVDETVTATRVTPHTSMPEEFQAPWQRRQATSEEKQSESGGGNGAYSSSTTPSSLALDGASPAVSVKDRVSMFSSPTPTENASAMLNSPKSPQFRGAGSLTSPRLVDDGDIPMMSSIQRVAAMTSHSKGTHGTQGNNSTPKATTPSGSTAPKPWEADDDDIMMAPGRMSSGSRGVVSLGGGARGGDDAF